MVIKHAVCVVWPTMHFARRWKHISSVWWVCIVWPFTGYQFIEVQTIFCTTIQEKSLHFFSRSMVFRSIFFRGIWFPGLQVNILVLPPFHNVSLLTVKFGNRQRRHRLRVIIGCSISGSADGSYQVANSQIPAIFG